jgi:hypothetical protein
MKLLWCPHKDSNRGPTDYKASTLRAGLSLAVADITNFTENIICPDTSSRSSLAPYYPQRSSALVLLQDQGLLIRKVGEPRGYGLSNEETGVG